MERKRWKKPTGVILLLASFFFLIWPGFRVWKAAELNAVLENLYDSSKEFTYSELYTSFLQGGYCKNIPVKDMAGELTKYVDSNTVIGGAGPFSLETMELPVDITYYSAPDTDSQAVFEISMGTEIVVNPQPEGGWMANGYGCVGLPDYTRGWRCVRPFMEAGSGEDPEKLPYYYVPMEDLETILRQYVHKVNENREIAPWSAEQENLFVEQHLRNCDSVLYSLGIFSSPDLSYPIWDTWDTVLLGGFIALFLAGSILLLLEKKFESDTN